MAIVFLGYIDKAGHVSLKPEWFRQRIHEALREDVVFDIEKQEPESWKQVKPLKSPVGENAF
jgi:hypothetical protein